MATRAQRLAAIAAQIKAIQAKMPALTRAVRAKVAAAAPPPPPPPPPAIPSPRPVAPTIFPAEQERIRIQTEIARVEAEIQKRREALAITAKKAGVTIAELPPETVVSPEILKKVGLEEVVEEPPIKPPEEPEDIEAKESTKRLEDLIASLAKSQEERIESITASLAALTGARVKEKEEEREKVEVGIRGWMKRMAGLIEKREPMEEILRRELEPWKIPETLEKQRGLMSEITGLREQLIGVKGERDRALMVSEARRAPMAFITEEQRRINRDYDRRESTLSAEIGAKVALMESYRGNIEQARGMVRDIVNASVYDQERDWRMISDWVGLNMPFYTNLSAEIRESIDDLQSLALLRLQNARADRNFVLTRMIDNPEANILFSDTPEQAAEKAAAYLRTIPEEPEEIETDAQRIAVLDKFIDERRGADKLISTETYLEARKKWIELGGTVTDFYTAYAPDDPSLMGAWEQKKLPIDIRPEIIKQFITKDWIRKLYPLEQLETTSKEAGFTTIKKGLVFKEEIGDIEGYLDYLMTAVQQYRDAGMTDEEILRVIGTR